MSHSNSVTEKLIRLLLFAVYSHDPDQCHQPNHVLLKIHAVLFECGLVKDDPVGMNSDLSSDLVLKALKSCRVECDKLRPKWQKLMRVMTNIVPSISDKRRYKVPRTINATLEVTKRRLDIEATKLHHTVFDCKEEAKRLGRIKNSVMQFLIDSRQMDPLERVLDAVTFEHLFAGIMAIPLSKMGWWHKLSGRILYTTVIPIECKPRTAKLIISLLTELQIEPMSNHSDHTPSRSASVYANRLQMTVCLPAGNALQTRKVAQMDTYYRRYSAAPSARHAQRELRRIITSNLCSAITFFLNISCITDFCAHLTTLYLRNVLNWTQQCLVIVLSLFRHGIKHGDTNIWAAFIACLTRLCELTDMTNSQNLEEHVMVWSKIIMELDTIGSMKITRKSKYCCCKCGKEQETQSLQSTESDGIHICYYSELTAVDLDNDVEYMLTKQCAFCHEDAIVRVNTTD
eukprot:207060_1